MVWNPGDDTDLNEGGGGADTVEVNGGNGAEEFATTANGARVRFDRLDPAPFAIDIGTSENLVVNANGGDDSFSATGNLAALIAITVDGGAGNDTILGGNGVDLLLGGEGNDFVDGQQGNDVAFLGAGDDTLPVGSGRRQRHGRRPGRHRHDGVQRQRRRRDLRRRPPTASALRFTRNVGNIVMDIDDVELVDLNALGGSRHHHRQRPVRHRCGRVRRRPGRRSADGDDLAADNVVVNGTNGDDVAIVTGQGPTRRSPVSRPWSRCPAPIAGSDRVTVNALAGDDVVDASGLSADSALLTLDGGDDDDVLIGGDGDDVLLGGPGDDVLIGGPGNDTIDGGDGDNIVIQAFGADTVTSATAAGMGWLASNARTVDGKTVLDVGSKPRTLPHADLSQLIQDATSS